MRFGVGPGIDASLGSAPAVEGKEEEEEEEMTPEEIGAQLRALCASINAKLGDTQAELHEYKMVKTALEPLEDDAGAFASWALSWWRRLRARFCSDPGSNECVHEDTACCCQFAVPARRARFSFRRSSSDAAIVAHWPCGHCAAGGPRRVVRRAAHGRTERLRAHVATGRRWAAATDEIDAQIQRRSKGGVLV